jgi:photosystem II stability/assembly factor-like uncharacterized protein
MKLSSKLLSLALAAAGALAFVAAGTQPARSGPNNNRRGWHIIGPGGGGAQYRPTVSPHDPNTVLVACDMTGNYITRDGGRSWRQFNLRTRTDAFAFDPKDPKVIYAGSSGLFRSEDGGERWRLVFPSPSAVTAERMAGDHAQHSFVSKDNWPGGSVQAIRIDPEQTAHIYVAVKTADSLLVFHSTDGGGTWKRGGEVAGKETRALYLDTTSPKGDRRLYVFTDAGLSAAAVKEFRPESVALPAGVRGITAAAAGFDPAARRPVFYVTTQARFDGDRLSTGVYRSTDLGRTWAELRGGLERGAAGRAANRPPVFTLVACAETAARTVYLVAQRFPEASGEGGAAKNFFGTLKSTDGGDTWEWVLKATGREPPPNKRDGWLGRSFGPGWGGPPTGLGVGPSNPEVVYATDMGTTYRTVDAGRTWEQVYSEDQTDGSAKTRGLDVTTTYGVHFDPRDSQHLAISYTDIGLFHSTNGGRSWLHSIKGVPEEWVNTCYWVVFDPEVKGRAWSAWGNAHDLPRPKMFRGGDFGRYKGGVARTDDGLATWQRATAGMPDNTVTTHLVLDPKSPAGRRTLYAAGFGKGVFKSTDDGRTWALKNEGVAGNLNAWRLVLTPGGTLYLLVARGLEGGREVDGALYKSSDGAEHWQRVEMPSGANAPNDLVYDPSEPGRMYLAAWPRTLDGTERHGGLHVTEDGGDTWRNVFDPSAHVYGVAVDAERPATLFINTFDGAAYRSDDRGRAWRRLGGYNFKWGHRPVVDPHNKGMLYLTTFGSSVWHGPAEGVAGAFEDVYPIR